MNATAETIFQFKNILKNLDGCLTKANAYADQRKFDVNALVTARLAPDMFSFDKQIQSTCDVAKFAAAYLSGKTPPKHEDTETTWAQLHERIGKVVSYLETFKPEDFTNAATAKVSPGWAKGKWFSGADYLHQVAVPNFYFHAMAAYTIMRHNGVDIGKMDYLGNVKMND